MPAAIVALIATIGVPGLVTGGALTTLGTIVSGVIGVGLSFVANALFAPKVPKPQDVKGVIRQSVPPRTKVYGLARRGGKLLLIETVDGDLLQVVYFSQGPINAYLNFILDERETEEATEEWDEADGPQPPDWVPLTGFKAGRTQHFFPLEYRLGTPDQTAMQYLIDAIDDPTIVDEDFRCRGCAVVYFEATGVRAKNFAKVYPNRIPVLNVEAEWCPVYDPRLGLTVFHHPSDDTKIPGRNLVLILRQYLTDPDGMQIDPAYIEDTPGAYGSFSDAADNADEIIATKGGGTEHRYYGEFSYDFDSDPTDNVRRLMTATAGRLFLLPTGKIGFLPGKWIEPTVSIPDSALSFFSLSDRSGPLRDANEVVVKYTNVLARYSEASAQAWRDEADISAVGQIKSATIEAYEIQNHNHARRIAKIEAAKRNPRWQGTVRGNLMLMNAWDQRFIRLQVLDLDIDYETFEVLAVSLDPFKMEVTLQVASMGPEAFDFDPETEEGTPPVNPDDLDPDSSPTVDDLEVECEQRVVGARSVAVIVANWSKAAHDRKDLDAEAQYALADTDDWQPMDIGDGGLSAETPPLIDGQTYDIRVRWNKPAGSPGTWALVENVLALADAVAPDAPIPTEDAIFVDGATVTVSFRTSNSANNRSLIFYRAEAWQTSSDAVQIAAINTGSANLPYFIDDTPGSGEWIYFAKGANSLNGMGVLSGFSAATPVAQVGTKQFVKIGSDYVTIGSDHLTIG